ncbi:MAG: DUF11 domain-containing protein [Phycisphaeraceae bacterium]|nr:DUF11 domain-containing protein [Phycisphaeraceae bacterium]
MGLKSSWRMLSAAALLLGVLGAGCSTTRSTSQTTQAEPVRTEPRATRVSWYRPSVGENMNIAELFFPTGDNATSALLLHTVTPKTVNRNSPYDVEIHATNTSSGTLQNVIVGLESSSNMRVASSTPAAQQGPDGTPQWALGDLGPGKTQIIRLRASSEQVGTAGNCLSASYNNQLCATLQVVEPNLTLTKKATQQALLCDDIVLQYEVCNPGTGIARGVRIVDELPQGLTVNGSRSINIDVGDLGPGACKPFNLIAKAGAVGRYESAAKATSGELSADSAKTTTVITQPVLAISSDCTETAFVGRTITYRFTVENTGTAPSTNTIVSGELPSGTELRSASDSGAANGRTVVWNVGTLAPGASKTVNAVVTPSGIGRYTMGASVIGNCAARAAANCTTNVVGIAAIQLEVIDTDDPVEVGQTTTYTIEVLNEGSADDTNIRIVCELPEQEQFVAAGGETNATVNGRVVTFAPLPKLAAGATARWQVTVRATASGDVRFKTILKSDQMKSPAEETEPTNLYE